MRNYQFHCAVLLFCITSFTACTRGELPIQPHQSGNVTTATADIGSTYKYQVYYNLHTNTVVGQNEKTIWDIGLETSANGYHVILNGAKSMYALSTTNTNFNAVGPQDTLGFSQKAKCDSYTGSVDSTAIGNWRNSMQVYIIDRGFDDMGVHQGWSKLQMLSVTDTTYNIHFAALDGTNETSLTVLKDSAYNLSFVSFTTGAQVQVEPPKHTWDIVFSQYTFVFYDMNPPTPYLVTGCLLNRYNTTAYIDTLNTFDNISFSNKSENQLSPDISTIGYDWKEYNGKSYTIHTNKNYVVKTAAGLYFKMHFIGFYNASGVKGSPQWELQQL